MDFRVEGFLSIHIAERTRLGKGRGAAMEINRDQGKRNTAERRRVPRSEVRFQVTAINGKPAPDVFILDISPLGANLSRTEGFPSEIILPGKPPSFSFSANPI